MINTGSQKAESKNHASPEDFSALLDSLDDFLAIVGLDGKILHFNQTLVRKLGYTRHELQNMSILDLHPPEMQSRAREMLSRLKNQDVASCFIPLMTSRGNTIPVETRLSRGRWNGTDVIFGIARDISEQIDTESELQYRQNFERLITTISSRFINLRPENTDAEIREALRQIGCFTGVDRSYLFLFNDDLNRMLNTYEWVDGEIDAQKISVAEFGTELFPWFMSRLKNFENIYIPSTDAMPPEAQLEKDSMTARGIKSRLLIPMLYGGKLRGFLGFDSIQVERTWPDDFITLIKIAGEIFVSALERRNFDSALRQSESRYQELFNCVVDGLGIVDENELIVMCNPAFGKILEVENHCELIGRSILDFIPENFHDFILAQTEIRRQNRSSQYEVDIITAKNNRRVVLASISPRFDETGKYTGTFGNFVDFTERRNMEEQLQAAKDAAESASRAKSSFLANMSHELRTPLNSIIGFADLLEQENRNTISQEHLEYIRIIAQSGHHLMDLINDILDLAKIEAGKSVLEIAEVNLGQLVRDSIKTVQGMARSAEVRLGCDANQDCRVMADAKKLKQILYNLLSNAIKFTPAQGSVQLSLEEQGQEYIICVSDTGIGIKKEDQELIFGEFQQVDHSLARKFQGTGLGLSLSRNLVEMHGGRIWVESEPGQGSNFFIALPVGQIISSKQEKTENDSVENKNGSSINILVIDDEEFNLRLIRSALQKHDFSIMTATSAMEGIEFAQKYGPDIILLDIQLPDMNGLDALDRLKANKNTTDIPVIAVTGQAMPEDRERFLVAGFSDYISKPIDIKELPLKIKDTVINKN